MPRYIHYNNAELPAVLQWADDQGPHKFIGLYQAGQDWLIVIEPIRMGRPPVEKPVDKKNGK